MNYPFQRFLLAVQLHLAKHKVQGQCQNGTRIHKWKHRNWKTQWIPLENPTLVKTSPSPPVWNIENGKPCQRPKNPVLISNNRIGEWSMTSSPLQLLDLPGYLCKWQLQRISVVFLQHLLAFSTPPIQRTSALCCSLLKSYSFLCFLSLSWWFVFVVIVVIVVGTSGTPASSEVSACDDGSLTAHQVTWIPPLTQMPHWGVILLLKIGCPIQA